MGSARVIETTYGNASPSLLMNTRSFNEEEASKLPDWTQELEGNGHHTPETEEYGISSFVYAAERPFNPHRLRSLKKAGMDMYGVLRSKGVVWAADQHEFLIEWSQAGSSMSLKFGDRRWLDAPEADTKYNSCQNGDRRQEIVFIGKD